MWWSDGRIYEGEFYDGKKHGVGTLKWPDGRSYSGQWLEGKQHGTAIACTARGLKRSSEWKNGKFLEWVGGVVEDTGQQPVGATVVEEAEGMAPTCDDN